MPKDLPIWNYFEESDYGYRIAVCNYCHRELSYKTTITNLKVHLKQRHKVLYNEFLNLSKDPETRSPEGKPSNDESDVEESQNNTYQEVVYLYDSDAKSTKKETRETPVRTKKAESPSPVMIHREKEREKEKEKKERDKTDVIQRRKRRRMSTFVEEEPPAAKSDADEGDDEIDKFGKYVVCLMKTVPKELCAQLQMDIINQVMNAKIKYLTNKPESAETQGDSYVVMNEGGKIQHMEVADDDAEKTTDDANEQGTYEQVVYVQDADTKAIKEIRLKKLDGPDRKQESEHRKRRLNATHTDDRGGDDEEIEKFGKYITCLMKTVPNEISTQLQMEIINTIMRGKIKFMTKLTPVPPSNVIVEKLQTPFQPSMIVTMANETAHMPLLETNTVVASQA